MRRVGLSDFDLAARAVMAVSDDLQPAFAAHLIAASHDSDLWRKRHGRTHPKGGTGSLYAEAGLHPRAPCDCGGDAYVQALGVVCAALLAWRTQQARRS